MTCMYLGSSILNNDVCTLKKVEKKLSKLLITPGLPNSLYIYIEVLQLKLPNYFMLEEIKKKT